MKYLTRVIFALVVSTLIVSCRREGCTDCNATNYDSKARKDDSSCEYINNDRMGLYSISDSIVDPFQTVYFDDYTIEIEHGGCDPNRILISNYGNIKNSSNEPLAVVGEILGDSIHIDQQVILGPDANSTTDYISIDQSVGYFSNDSIYLRLIYSDRFDPYYGDCWGGKN